MLYSEPLPRDSPKHRGGLSLECSSGREGPDLPGLTAFWPVMRGLRSYVCKQFTISVRRVKG